MAEFASKFNVGCVIQYHSDQWVQSQKCTIIANSRKVKKPCPYIALYKVRMVLMHESTSKP